jgi:ABC-2 type transport system ATP-binding protein
MPEQPVILEIKNLVKKFGDILAVDHLSLKIREGTCFGLLGPNGAGKTTTIEMIEGITPPDAGEIFFKSAPVSRKFHQNIGIQFQSTALQDRLKVGEVLTLFKSFYKKTIALADLIEWCRLSDILDRDCNKLSGGQRQRLLLALSLINDPDLVFLDEPTTGLDPQARRDFWDLIASIKKKKKTIVLTTHYMEEAYELCDEIAIMNAGKIIAQGAPDTLLRKYFQGLWIRLPKQDFKDGSVLDQLLKSNPSQVRLLDDSVEIQTEKVNEMFRYLIDHGVSLEGIQVRSKNLEDLFLELTGRPKDQAKELLDA